MIGTNVITIARSAFTVSICKACGRRSQAVIAYLEKIDPEAAERARARYACFDHFAGDTQRTATPHPRALWNRARATVVDQLIDLRRRAAEYANRDGQVAREEFFFAEQNARLALNAEHYYRAMFRGRHSSWNIRDTHMADTFDALLAFLGRDGIAAEDCGVGA